MMDAEDFRTLFRAYVALSLAHHAAGQCALGAAPHPHLAAAISNQTLAIRELEGFLGRALPEVAGMLAPQGAVEECSAMLM